MGTLHNLLENVWKKIGLATGGYLNAWMTYIQEWLPVVRGCSA